MSKKKKIGIVLASVLAVIVVVLAVNHNLTGIVFFNLFPGTVKLDESTQWDGGESYEFVEYAELSDAQYLHLYVPDSEKPAPLLILIHGGGFYFNDNESRQTQFMYRYFRDHGYACASINYRLGDEAGYPAAIEDVKAAIRYLRANAEYYGYDGEKFAVWGESAGGYLAVMAGVTDDEEFDGVIYKGEDVSAKERVSAEVSLIIDYYGCVELGTQDDYYEKLGIPQVVLDAAGLWLRPVLRETGYETIEGAWLRQDVDELSQEQQEKVNPAYYIQKNLDENSQKYVIIRHGDADLDVPYLQSEKIYQVFSDTIGEDKTDLVIEHNYKHASDRFYSDTYLSRIEIQMNHVFSK